LWLPFFAIGWLASLTHASATQGETFRFQAKSEQTFRSPPSQPLLMPTAVAVAEDGRIFVADGVNDRIVEFGANGEFNGEIRAVGDHQLHRPMSVKIDATGSLWIADTGNQRILVRRQDGALERVITLPVDGQVMTTDITDLALTSGHQYLWAVDNDHHRLVRINLQSSESASMGGRGSEMGRFQFPFMLASGPNDSIFVTDTLNGRVLRLSDPSILPHGIGSYGVDAGQLYRPKGIAVDSMNRVWIADGPLGVVQVFDTDGTFLGIVRDVNGDVLHFDTPCGLARSENQLYVVELRPGQVRKLEIEVLPVDTKSSGAQAARRQSQPPTCTACHLEWMEPFVQNRATILANPPSTSLEEPYVSRSQSCLSCHDGSVVDSRRQVWQDHGHRTGVRPSPNMNVPTDLPLVSGTISCRTCHSAHTHVGTGNILKDAVFLRVKENAEELCVKCHTSYQGELEHGFHPTRALLVGLSSHVPDELVSAGAHLASKGTTGCLICHSGHGSASDRLLLRTATADRLCLACHEGDHLKGHGYTPVGHPVQVKLSPPQHEFAKSLKSGSDDPLLHCTTCHQLHGGQNGNLLLGNSISESGLCLGCHSGYATLVGSSHDLRLTAPEETNARGVSTTTEGPCSACHTAHGSARATASRSSDPQNACVTCHRPDGCAESTIPARNNHPTEVPPDVRGSVTSVLPFYSPAGHRDPQGNISCATCHNPHADSRHGSALLRAPNPDDPASLCVLCHVEARPLGSSLHRPERLNPEGPGNSCAPCHAVHRPSSDSSGGMWTGLTGGPPSPRRTWHCTGCHSAAAGQHDIIFRPHPVIPMLNINPPGDAGYMPLLDSEGHSGASGQIACLTCHLPHGRLSGGGYAALDVHATAEPMIHAVKSMLRPYVAPNLCSTCHGFDGLRLFLYYHRNPNAGISTNGTWTAR